MKRIREWALNPHPEHGYMCLEGVMKEVQAKPGDCGPMVDKTIRTSRIVGFGACEDGVIVHTKGEETWDAHKPSNKYLLVGMSREDMIERAAMRQISSLILDPGGWPSAGSYIAEALMEAYAEGMDSTEE